MLSLIEYDRLKGIFQIEGSNIYRVKLEIRNLKLGFLLSQDVDFRKPDDFGYS